MTDKYKPLRDALAAGPTAGPWFVSDGLGFAVAAVAKTRVCADIAPKVSPAVDATYIAAAHPETIRALLAERDELESALTLSGKVSKRLMDELAVVVAERDALREALSACRNYISDNRESRAAAELAQMIDAALTQHQGEKHGDQDN